MTDPVGRLIVEAERKARKKPNGHTATAECGCQVTITWFSERSNRAEIDRCADHPIERTD